VLFQVIESKAKPVGARGDARKVVPGVLLDRTKRFPDPLAVRDKDVALSGKVPVATDILRGVPGGQESPSMRTRHPVQVVAKALQVGRDRGTLLLEPDGILQHPESFPGTVETGV
jgi:hypothetical protein